MKIIFFSYAIEKLSLYNNIYRSNFITRLRTNLNKAIQKAHRIFKRKSVVNVTERDLLAW